MSEQLSGKGAKGTKGHQLQKGRKCSQEMHWQGTSLGTTLAIFLESNQ